MNKIVSILLFCFPVLSYTQSLFIEVENIPSELLPKKVEKIGFIFSDTSEYAAFGYPLDKGKFKVLAKTGDLEGAYGMPDMNAVYEDQMIVFSTRAPWKATTFLWYYSWDGKKLVLQKTDHFDPSWEEIEAAEEAFKNGNIKEAVDHYNSVQYPSSYLDEGAVAMELFSKANQLGLIQSKQKKFADAAGYIADALNFYYLFFIFTTINEDPQDEKSYVKSLEDYNLTAYQDSIGKWLGNYGYFLYKADSLDKSIEVNSHINKIYPKLSGPYLQLGDALFDKGKLENAKKPYLQYVALMTEKNKEGSIPQRVHDRIK